MTTHRTTSSPGIGFASLLTLVFIVLKLVGAVDWSWLWVLAPLWISALLTAGFLVTIGAIALIVIAVKERRR